MASLDPFITRGGYVRRRGPRRALHRTPRAVFAWGVLLPASLAACAFATNSAPASLAAIALVVLGWSVPYEDRPGPRRRRRRWRRLPYEEQLQRVANWSQIVNLAISLAALAVALIALLTHG